MIFWHLILFLYIVDITNTARKMAFTVVLIYQYCTANWKRKKKDNKNMQDRLYQQRKVRTDSENQT